MLTQQQTDIFVNKVKNILDTHFGGLNPTDIPDNIRVQPPGDKLKNPKYQTTLSFGTNHTLNQLWMSVDYGGRVVLSYDHTPEGFELKFRNHAITDQQFNAITKDLPECIHQMKQEMVNEVSKDTLGVIPMEELNYISKNPDHHTSFNIGYGSAVYMHGNNTLTYHPYTFKPYTYELEGGYSRNMVEILTDVHNITNGFTSEIERLKVEQNNREFAEAIATMESRATGIGYGG